MQSACRGSFGKGGGTCERAGRAHRRIGQPPGLRRAGTTWLYSRPSCERKLQSARIFQLRIVSSPVHGSPRRIISTL